MIESHAIFTLKKKCLLVKWLIQYKDKDIQKGPSKSKRKWVGLGLIQLFPAFSEALISARRPAGIWGWISLNQTIKVTVIVHVPPANVDDLNDTEKKVNWHGFFFSFLIKGIWSAWVHDLYVLDWSTLMQPIDKFINSNY